EGIQGRGKLANTTGGSSAVVRLGSASGAAAQVKFMHTRSLSPCPEVNICDVFWKPFPVPGIPSAQGSVSLPEGQDGARAGVQAVLHLLLGRPERLRGVRGRSVRNREPGAVRPRHDRALQPPPRL